VVWAVAVSVIALIALAGCGRGDIVAIATLADPAGCYLWPESPTFVVHPDGGAEAPTFIANLREQIQMSSGLASLQIPSSPATHRSFKWSSFGMSWTG
jgi:hypothetical protein